MILADVNENREVGRYFSNQKPEIPKCAVEDQVCARFEDWQALAKPFMNQ